MSTYTRKKIERIMASGTPKEKAMIVTKNYELKRYKDPLILTDEEEQSIIDSFTTKKDADAFNEWIEVWHAINRGITTVFITALEAQSAINDLMIYVHKWDAYRKEVDHLNALTIHAEDNAGKDFISSFKGKVSSFVFTHAEIRTNKNGEYILDVDGDGQLYDIIKRKAERCEDRLCTLKGVMNAYKDFIRKHHCKDFVPIIYYQEIDRAKEQLNNSARDCYAKSYLNAEIRKGYKPTREDKKLAVIPDLDEVKASKHYYDLSTRELYDK